MATHIQVERTKGSCRLLRRYCLTVLPPDVPEPWHSESPLSRGQLLEVLSSKFGSHPTDVWDAILEADRQWLASRPPRARR